MKFIVLFLFLIFLLLWVVVGGTYLIFNFFMTMGIKPGNATWDKLINALRDGTEPLAQSLVPWDGEMLGLLSLNQMNKQTAGIFGGTTKGIFTTVYQEPIVAYALQKTKSAGVILARTSDREFIFRLKGKETEIWVNQQAFAVLVDGVLLASGKNSRQLARLDNKPDEMQSPLYLGEKTAASIINPLRANAPNPRMVTLLRTLSTEEETVVLALAILQGLR